MNSKNENKVRVRFAPSPTGFLHVGGARTAIFNWLYARNTGGRFLLRIEDTDPERSKGELTAQILRTMKWLGLEADEPVVYQSDKTARYNETITQLLNNGKAYYAFETHEELAKKKRSGMLYKYDRSALNLSKKQIIENLNNKKPYVIRFFVPDGITEFDDLVHGKTAFKNSDIEDFVLMRSTGSPTYQIAVVTDDHDMKITHVIRGDDHLSNTPKQVMLYRALGWNIPVFAHLPLILDESKKKLSKRRDTVSVEEYVEQGYLAEALFNFLSLTGFSPPAGKEIFTKEELISLFSVNRINKKPAVFDTKKLKWINFEYIQKTDTEFIIKLFREFLSKRGVPVPGEEYLDKVYILMKPRIETVNEIYLNGKYFFEEPEEYDEKGITKHWTADIREIFKDYFEMLQKHPENFNASEIESELRSFTEMKNIKASQLIHVLRIALTGGTASPGIFELMEVMGKDTVIKRIEKFIKNNK